MSQIRKDIHPKILHQKKLHQKKPSLQLLCIAMFLLTLLLTSCQKEERGVIEPPQVERQDGMVEPAGAEEGGQEDGTQETESAQETETAQGAGTAQAAEIPVYLNGNHLVLTDPAYQAEEFIMVPIAQICEYFSRDLVCTQDGNTLTIEDEDMGNTIVLTEGSDRALLNGNEVNLETPPVLAADGNLMTELSAFRVLLDADCKYQEEMQSIYITESGLC